jgi:hypothetical protein
MVEANADVADVFLKQPLVALSGIDFDESSSRFSSLIEHDLRANALGICRVGKPHHTPHPVSAKATPGPLAHSAAEALAKAASAGQAFPDHALRAA